MIRSYSEEGGESIAKQALGGIHRAPDGEEDQSKPGKELSEDAGKCCKT